MNAVDYRNFAVADERPNRKLLQDRAPELLNKMKAMTAKLEKEGRDFNSTEQIEFAELSLEFEKTLDQLKESDAANERQRALQPVRDINRDVHEQGWPTGFGGGQHGSADAMLAQQRSGVGLGRDYRTMFGKDLSNDGFKSFDEFLAPIHLGLFDGRLVPQAAMDTTTGSGGGFLVPTEYAAGMLDAALENEIVRPRAEVWPMKTDTKKVAGFDCSDSSSTLFGGLSGEWLGESGTATDSDAKVRMIQLTAMKLGLFTRAPNELVEDGMSFTQLLTRTLIKAMGWFMDDGFLNGDGSGKPKGVLHDAALVTVSKESSQAASTITYKNLTTIFSRLHPSCVTNAVWVANNTCIPELCALTIPSGTAGTHIPVMTSKGGRFEILTRPVLFTEKVPTVGTAGDIGLYDFSQYVIGMRKEVGIEQSRHVGWQTDQTGYRSIVRTTGQGKWAQAYTPKNGSTLSWCVVVEDR